MVRRGEIRQRAVSVVLGSGGALTSDIVHRFVELLASYGCGECGGVFGFGRGEGVGEVGDVGVVDGAENLREKTMRKYEGKGGWDARS
jgi:hypothetical protein